MFRKILCHQKIILPGINTGVSTFAWGNSIKEVLALLVEHSAMTVNFKADISVTKKEKKSKKSTLSEDFRRF